MPVSKNVECLVKKMKDELGVDVRPYSFRRTYAKRWQIEQGAFSWCIDEDNPKFSLPRCYGSSSPLSECIKKTNELHIIYSMGTETFVEPQPRQSKK